MQFPDFFDRDVDVGNRIDITELKRTAEELRVRELYLRATLDNLPFFFWLKDSDGRFLAVNKVFSDACGQPGPESVVGLTDRDVWPAELAEKYIADDLAVMAGRREVTVEEPVASGAAAGWIETYKKPVVAEDGTLLGTVGFARDITERRRIDQMKDELISTVSHELRTPLTSIKGSLALLNAGVVGDLPPNAAELVDIACSNTERLILLINDLLDFQKVTYLKCVIYFKLTKMVITLLQTTFKLQILLCIKLLRVKVTKKMLLKKLVIKQTTLV